MQIFFPIPRMLAATVQTDSPAAAALGLGALLTIFLIALGSMVIANWVASLIVARPTATLWRAVLMPFVWLFALMGYGIVMSIVAIGIRMATQSNDFFNVFGIVIGIGFLLMFVYVPMRVYQIGFWQGVGFAILSIVIGTVLEGVAQYVILGPATIEAMAAQFPQTVTKVRQLQNPPTPTPPPKISREELQQRQTALKNRLTQLEIRRRYLPANDSKAFAEYTKERAAYDRDVEQWKADAATLEDAH